MRLLIKQREYRSQFSLKKKGARKICRNTCEHFLKLLSFLAEIISLRRLFGRKSQQNRTSLVSKDLASNFLYGSQKKLSADNFLCSHDWSLSLWRGSGFSCRENAFSSPHKMLSRFTQKPFSCLPFSSLVSLAACLCRSSCSRVHRHCTSSGHFRHAATEV